MNPPLRRNPRKPRERTERKPGDAGHAARISSRTASVAGESVLSVPVLHLDNLVVDLARRRVLQGLNLRTTGGSLGLLGPNGAGKSTLIRTLLGFHRPVGKERRITGIRQATAARALVLRLGDSQVAIVSLDICGVSGEMTARIQSQVAQKLGIPAGNVRLCATHTHSMPGFRYFRQWGAISPEYMASVEAKIVQAVEKAQADLAPAEDKVAVKKYVDRMREVLER